MRYYKCLEKCPHIFKNIHENVTKHCTILKIVHDIKNGSPISYKEIIKF